MSRAHPEGLDEGKGGGPGMPLCGAPPPSSNTGSHLHSGEMSLLPCCIPSFLPDGILNTPTSATTFQLQSFLKKQKCVSWGVILLAALPCTRCLQPVLHGSLWLLSLKPSALAVSLSLGQLPMPQGAPGPISSWGCSLVCSIVGQVGRCCVNGQGKRNFHSSYTHLSKVPVPVCQPGTF